MDSISRRDFARSASLATAASYSRILGANDRVRMGYIGLGNRGDQVHDAFLEHGDAADRGRVRPARGLPGLRGEEVPRHADAVQGLQASCWTTRTWMPWSSPRPITGTR